jgi:hypothetical protein
VLGDLTGADDRGVAELFGLCEGPIGEHKGLKGRCVGRDRDIGLVDLTARHTELSVLDAGVEPVVAEP